MILKKQEKDNIIKAMYDSSNVLASVYDTNTNDLILIFNKGNQYKYQNVSFTDYTRFEIAESQGKVFNTHIKSHSFQKLGQINPEEIYSEINSLKAAEKNALLEGLQLKVVDIMKGLVSDSDKQFNKQRLESLQKAISTYIEELDKNEI